MSRDRWEQIKSSLHFNDNSVCPSEDKLFKVRPVIDFLKESFARIAMDHMLSLDEQMVPFKGGSSLKQYLPSKSHKWGYKLFVLSDVNGIVHNFEVYTGKIEKAEGHPDLGASSNIVLRLSNVIPAAEPVSTLKRWDKKTVDVECPSMVMEYNKFMGGVDLLDSLTALYRISLLSKKYYLRLFFHFVDLATVTAWLLSRRDCDQFLVPQGSQQSLLDFKMSVAETLRKQGKSPSKKRGRNSGSAEAAWEKEKVGHASKPIP
ncbi:piggyBac transposable element-derived protein 2-like [Ixodes scapularis]